jgi:iduronate 2-sulfatase
MRVPGDIIAGTDGADVEACWTRKYNSPGREAHTPGKYACLNLNHFTSELKGRETTQMPNRMFVTVRYKGDGTDQPDWNTATKSIEILKRLKNENKPFFLATGFIRPHYPNVAPQKYFDIYPYKKIVLPFVPSDDWHDMPKQAISKSNSAYFGIDKFQDNQKRMWAGYLATVTYMDEQVGRILHALKQLNMEQDTAVIFTSDHGYLLGEHNFWQKGNLREEVTRVPLIIRTPYTKPARTNAIVELIDMFPTACDVVGLPIPQSLHGESLIPIMENPELKTKGNALSFVSKGTSIRTSTWNYIKYKDDTEELYDMKNDPKQFTNLAKIKTHKEDLNRLRAMLSKKTKNID